MAQHPVAILWLRRALRLADNPALADALASAAAVVPAFVIGADEAAAWPPGSASRAWLARSLVALDGSLRALGSGLVIRSGSPVEALRTLAAECGASLVCFDERFEPETVVADRSTRMSLEAAGLMVRSINCSLVNHPSGPLGSGGGPFKVFTPYHTACLRLGSPEPPLPAPDRIPSPGVLAAGIAPSSALRALSTDAAPPMLSAYFELGEAGAHALADRFFADAVARYPADRDRPDLFGTSRLSPHLAFGEIGPRQLLAAARQASACDGTCPDAEGATAFTRQLYWREFAYHQMHHFPRTTDEPLRAEFRAMPWADDPGGLEAWRTGMTGYPIVDAGMRELAATGWMHNRVRMIVASFLTKDLLLPWQVGARHFWEHLVDADLANNSFGWQWVAGSGADAAPYFRVFNPALQGAKFDSAGTYVRTWVPELTRMPDRWLHRPHEAPPDVHAGAGVTLATTYPAPIVDHAEVRVRALRAYDSIRTGRR